MIDHLGLSVSDYERAKAFYAKALAPLDYSLIMEVTEAQTGHAAAAGFGAGGKPDLWIDGKGAMNKPVHVAILAKDRATESHQGCGPAIPRAAVIRRARAPAA